MTIEEAGEIILAGLAWVKCTGCEGSGRGVTRAAAAGGFDRDDCPCSESVTVTEVCGRCEGRGSTASYEYAEACTLLGIPFPDPPYTFYAFSLEISTTYVWRVQKLTFEDGEVWTREPHCVRDDEVSFTRETPIDKVSINISLTL